MKRFFLMLIAGTTLVSSAAFGQSAGGKTRR
jgi:hypothetical protein